MSRHVLASACAALIVIGAPQETRAQKSTVTKHKNIVATVAMVDSLPVRGAPFVVQRRPDQTPQDVILVGPRTTPDELSDAVWTLLNARRVSGDIPFEKQIVRMRPQQPSSKARKQYPGIQGMLGRLHSAKPRTIEGVGPARAIAIWLPRQWRNSGAMGPIKP